ncbi:hypothetical protein SAMN05216339_1242 [Nitrosomonas eutropha]|uniref:Uncharacterized protein n=2 Tax=Nitrosomonas eutropha TaxID=916 RepID=A0A1I7JFG9_9PROT|nr:hypothetical protein SAMN05216339_1242 [Nitrosomonas eutropha]
MMVSPMVLLAVFFLPLFPFSMVFNAALRAVRLVWLRAALLLIWPQIGVWLIAGAGMHLSQAWTSAVLAWATGTSLFYAWRMLSTRDFDIWIGFYASSAWALAWIGVIGEVSEMGLSATMTCLSVTALALALVSHCLRNRWGDAYVGLRPGLARAMPRLGMATTLSVLAALGTPVFPVFFAMIYLLILGNAVTVVSVLVVWLLWSWAGAQIWQGFLFGTPHAEYVSESAVRDDVPVFWTVLAALLAVAAIVAASFWSMTWLMH